MLPQPNRKGDFFSPQLCACACVFVACQVVRCVCMSEREWERERGVAQTGVSQTGKAAPYFPLKGKHDGVGLTTIQDSKLKGFNFFTRTGLRTVFPFLKGTWFSKKKHLQGWSGSTSHERASMLRACLSVRIILPGLMSFLPLLKLSKVVHS